MRKLDKRPKELKGLKPIEIKKERSYAYSTISFFILNNSLYIKLTGVIGTRWLVLQNYKEYTALEAIRKVDGGRHFEDGILKIWNDNGLDLGWMNKVLKDVR